MKHYWRSAAFAIPRRILFIICIVWGVMFGQANAASEASVLDVVTLNLWHDKADWPKRQILIASELARLQPDVILLQEVLQDEGLSNQAETLANLLGYRHYFASVDPEDQSRRYGNAILTRHPITATHWARLQPYGDHRTVAHVRMRFGGDEIDVFGTHLHYTEAGGAVRRIQVGDLVAFIQTHAGSRSVVLAGDFNTPADAPELESLTHRLILASATPIAHDGKVADSTLNPVMGHRPVVIDHVYADRRTFNSAESSLLFDRPDAEGTWASDHFGVRTRLHFHRSPSAID